MSCEMIFSLNKVDNEQKVSFDDLELDFVSNYAYFVESTS